jgi:hypothetical protein
VRRKKRSTWRQFIERAKKSKAQFHLFLICKARSAHRSFVLVMSFRSWKKAGVFT